jgi:hypothetical protein
MRRILWVAGASLGLHTLVFILFDRYRDMTFNLGALIGHGNDPGTTHLMDTRALSGVRILYAVDG